LDQPKTLFARLSDIARLVSFSVARPWLTAGLGLGVGALALWFTVTHFAMTTDTAAILSKNLPWRQLELAHDAAFPQDDVQTIVVVDGATPELADEAASALTARLKARTDVFSSVKQPDADPFWRKNGLLFASVDEVTNNTKQLVAAQPFLGPLAADPSLRGLMGALSTATLGVSTGQASLDQIHTAVRRLADTIEAVKAGKPAVFSWRTMITGKPADARELRHVIEIGPKLDYAKLKPGAGASDVVRAEAKALGLDPAHGVRVRLTGPVPMEDEEFGTLAERADLIATLAFCAIVVMLWFAVRSPRVIAAIILTTLVGLTCAAAWGLLLFQRFNVISVAFIPLFVGLGIDFGIQFSVRYRSERGEGVSAADALNAAGQGMGRSLTLAAAAIASGFLAFGPTNYAGVSQLGLVAGFGMVIALLLNLTLLPALLRLMQPPGAKGEAPPTQVQALDAFMLGHRRLVVGAGVALAVGSALLLPLVHFDFNPLHLRSNKVESVSTILDLMKDPNNSPNTLDVIEPNLAAANAMAQRLAKLPQVGETRTLTSFVPADQPAKLAAIADASNLLDLTLNPIAVQPPPSDAEVVTALQTTAHDLQGVAAKDATSAGADARRLSADLAWLAAAPPAARARVADVLIPGLDTILDQARFSLQAQPVTLDTLPPDFVRTWVAPDGKARIQVLPKGDPNSNTVLAAFTRAVAKIAPSATGAPIGIQRSGDTVSGAFIEAGVLSFIVITALLFFVLRRVRDVAITMAPIVLTGLLTMGSCVLLGLPLNFANIIALPLLFGIGVAFHIYFVMAWRSGTSHLLESSLTRAIFFSALTTATGFGSLWASSHPGTASMGKLLMISLVWTLVSALLFQPALMGPPPKDAAPAD
jgi:hopanoid biosynthesis associated RND transporter like protein HpnN